MPRMHNNWVQFLKGEADEVFKNEMVKIQNGDKTNDKCSVYNSSGGVINVCRAWISKLANRIRQLNARRN